METQQGQASERVRLDILHRFDILDSAPEKAFDNIVELAADLFSVPTVLISLVAEERQWFKAKVGLDVCETDRSISFCTLTIKEPDILEVCDTYLDSRFANNPLVTKAPHIRYYAGAPLIVEGGHAIGTLCLIDQKPRRPLSKAKRKLLQRLADQIMQQIELRALRAAGHIAKLVSATTSDAMILANTENVITEWNMAAEKMFGWSQAEAVGKPLSIIMPKRLAAKHENGLRGVVAGKRAKLFQQTIELPALHRNGQEFPIELSLTRWDNPETGVLDGFASIIRDISERKALEEERSQARQFLDEVIENLPAMVWAKDVKSRKYKILNRAGEKLIGRKREDIIGRGDDELFPEASDAYRSRDEKVLKNGSASIYEGEFTRPNGAIRRMRTKRALVGAESDAPYILGISEDITERYLAEQKIAHMAMHDPLTGLRNRAGIAKEYELLKASPDKKDIAILCIDLDQFKAVNDLHGHTIGDQLLSEFGSRFTQILPDNATAGRMGGDEFIAILPARNVEARAAYVAEQVLSQLSKNYHIGGKSIHAGLSIGIAVSMDDKTDFEALCQSADRALYRAKTQGRGQFCFFDEAMDRQATERRQLELELRQTIEDRALQVQYQPLACLETGQVNGFEALVRWNHPEQGYIGPDVFIPIAEESGLINELGDFVLETVIREAASWVPPLRVAINLSPVQFRNKNLITKINKLLEETKLDPGRLELEITEGVLIHDTKTALSTLESLRNLGIRIAMDDFGTGYSSLSYFRMFPFDKVKIDQSFVRDMIQNPQSLAIVQAVIGLGKGLGLSVVGEGVETEEQLAALRDEGCSMVQGFHISRPQPIEYFASVIKRSKVFTENQSGNDSQNSTSEKMAANLG
ncbi:bifunctional diguanylate cyclase/phosphodiesterase [Parasphingorhabdus cellanae]|uniref:EAL domain-containing protein n=1 Tax=Parasphingorhabdus cellanae TaxID=2806553 RepID=A0ABX7T4K1_9SPHN|nr:EAL domain-containing protein [Parasphingorhabdus cellanae]QTD56514.1 EAL domain-containing protein [Parasphingorhabdus cellanae]